MAKKDYDLAEIYGYENGKAIGAIELKCISVEQLAKAMKLGKPGEQVVVKSQFAFSDLKYEGFEVAEKDQYYVLRKARDAPFLRLVYS